MFDSGALAPPTGSQLTNFFFGSELTIPDNGNVFYAMNSSTDEYNFMLVEKGASVPREKSERYSEPKMLLSN